MEVVQRRRIRVLLVEDDAGDAFLVRELLAEVQAPVDLSVVSTIAEATAVVDTVDCVLLDLDLPDASGLRALQLLLTTRPHVAVCVLTGLSAFWFARTRDLVPNHLLALRAEFHHEVTLERA